MSWLARSIANTHDAVPQSEHQDTQSEQDHCRLSFNSDGDEDLDQGRGLKEDLSEFTDSLTRQLWGVASFIAPPPPPPLVRRQSSGTVCANDRTVSENEDDKEEFDELANEVEDCEYNAVEEEAVGVTEEVLAFARNIAHHPETWLDFPLSEEEDVYDDFAVSDAQYQHALAVEHLAPRLAALRIELCPAHMTEGYFWMVYFVLLHSRLNKQDGDLLSSPQIMQARSIWMQELHKRSKEDSHWLGTSTFHSLNRNALSPHRNLDWHFYEDGRFENMSNRISPFEFTTYAETVKHPYDDVEFIDKSVFKEDTLPKIQEDMDFGSSNDIPMQDDDEDDDYWLKEDADLVRLSGISIMVNEEDISFSDLEDDADFTMPVEPKLGSTEWNITTKT